MYFSFDFGWYSINLYIVCHSVPLFLQGEGGGGGGGGGGGAENFSVLARGALALFVFLVGSK